MQNKRNKCRSWYVRFAFHWFSRLFLSLLTFDVIKWWQCCYGYKMKCHKSELGRLKCSIGALCGEWLSEMGLISHKTNIIIINMMSDIVHNPKTLPSTTSSLRDDNGVCGKTIWILLSNVLIAIQNSMVIIFRRVYHTITFIDDIIAWCFVLNNVPMESHNCTSNFKHS